MEQFPNVGLRFNRIGLPPKVCTYHFVFVFVKNFIFQLLNKCKTNAI